MVIVNKKFVDKAFEETDNRTRVTEVGLIHCKIEVVDGSGKKWVRRFPLPKKTFKALRVIKGFLGWIDGVEGGVANGEIEFSNVPKQVVEQIKTLKNVGGFDLLKNIVGSKNPPLGLAVILKSLTKTYPELTLKVNGDVICGGKTRT